MKRIISLLLVFTMMVGILPTQGLAEEFFSEESFGAASNHDETFFEDDDFSAFFSDIEEEDLGAFFEEPAKAEERAADDSASSTPVEESFVAQAPAGEASALEENFSEDLFGAGTEFVEEPETVPEEELVQYEVAPEETVETEEAADAVQAEETAEAVEATGEAEAAAVPETTAAESQPAAEDQAGDVAEELEARDAELDAEAEELESRGAITTLELVTVDTYYDGTTMSVGFIWDKYTNANLADFIVRYSTSQSSLSDSSCSSVVLAPYDYTDPKTGKPYSRAATTSIPYVANTLYFAVVPRNASGEPLEQISNVVSWTPAPPDVSLFTATAVPGDAGKVHFEWSNMSAYPNIEGYLLYEGNTLKSTCEVTSLNPETWDLDGYTTVGKTYTFMLYTYIDKNSNHVYDEGIDLRSKGVGVDYIVAPATPLINKVINVTTTRVEVCWTAVKQSISGYRVFWYEDGKGIDYENTSNYIDVGKSATKCTIEGLTPLWKYCFVMKSYVTGSATDEDGLPAKEFSEPSNIVTKYCLPGVVQGAKATYNSTSNTVTIDWENQQKIDGNINGYAIYYIVDELDSFTKTYINTKRIPASGYLGGGLDTYTPDASLLNPKYGERYYFKMVASYGSNEGYFEDAIIFPEHSLIIVPPKVQELKATSLGLVGSSYQMQLDWKSLGVGVKYRVQRSTTATFKTPVEVAPAVTGTTFVDTGLELGKTYYYRVLGYVPYTTGSGNAEGEWSDVVTAMASPADPTILYIEDYTVTGGIPDPALAVEACGLNVKWNPVAGVDGYYVTLYDAYLAKQVGTKVNIKGDMNDTYTFKNLTASEPYYAIVQSYLGKAISPGAKSSTLAPILWIPQNTAPYNYTVTPVSATSVKVSWPAFKGVKGYYVNVVANGAPPVDGTFTTIVDAKVETNSYTIKGIKTGYKYDVTVASFTIAQGKEIRSDKPSSQVQGTGAGFDTPISTDSSSYNWPPCNSAHTETVQALPQKITGLKLSMKNDADGNPYAYLTWNKVAGLDEVNGGYLVTRIEDGEVFTIKGSDSNSFTDNTILASTLPYKPGDTVSYKVCAFVDMLNEADITKYAKGEESPVVSGILKVPGPVVKVENTSTGLIELKWDTPAWLVGFTDIEYNIYRAKGSQSFTKAIHVKKVAYDSSEKYSWIDPDTPLTADGKKYYYWVVSTIASTGQQYGKTGPKLGMVSGPPVSSLICSGVEARRVTLSWPATLGVKGYVIYSSTDNGTTWKKVKAVGKSKVSYTVKKLGYHQEYQFAISAKYKGGALSQKQTLTSPVKTAFSAVTPTNMTVTNGTTSKLSWTKVPDATGYRVALYDSATNTWKKYTTKKNKITIKDLPVGTQYDYYVYPYITWHDVTYPGDIENFIFWDSEYQNSTYYGAACVYVGPKAPSSLKITKVSSGYANFTWKEVSFNSITLQYRLEYSLDGKTWTKLTDTTGTQYSMTAPLVGTYFFRVMPYYEADGKTYFGTPRKKKATL